MVSASLISAKLKKLQSRLEKPSWIWFFYAFARHSTSSQSFCLFSYHDILAIRKRLLRSAITRHTREYKKLLLVKKQLLSDISNIFNSVDFYILQRSVDYNVKKAVNKIVKTHTKKLERLTRNTILPFTSKEMITNLWSSNLTSQQLEVLKYGLTHSICPPWINKSDVFTCFELINGTMIKHLKDRKEKGKVVDDLSHIANSYILVHWPTVPIWRSTKFWRI